MGRAALSDAARSGAGLSEAGRGGIAFSRDWIVLSRAGMRRAGLSGAHRQVAELRTEQGLDLDPMAAYTASGYAEKIAAERVGGLQAGWGA